MTRAFNALIFGCAVINVVADLMRWHMGNPSIVTWVFAILFSVGVAIDYAGKVWPSSISAGDGGKK
jgi:hypothetical protein